MCLRCKLRYHLRADTWVLGLRNQVWLIVLFIIILINNTNYDVDFSRHILLCVRFILEGECRTLSLTVIGYKYIVYTLLYNNYNSEQSRKLVEKIKLATLNRHCTRSIFFFWRSTRSICWIFFACDAECRPRSPSTTTIYIQCI